MLMQPKNWATFQHYKDRCPPWIKLHRDLLNDREFMRLPLASKALAPLLWLLASESKDGTFDGSLDELVFRLHITDKEYKDGIKPLIDKGFFVSDSTMLATSKQPAIPETERETETKRETKTEAPEGVSLEVWNSFVKQRKAKRAQITDMVIGNIKREAESAGWSLEDAFKEIVVRNWQSFKADWVAKPVNKADQVFTTVPSRFERDPALVAVEQKLKEGVPMPPEIKAALERLRK
ncbi:hypothetical protein UFOVP996_52 [uncultured Caudovirales phage]|uniref:Uncharacterized protein n=1 Tax=uncultured Caudovirales phage TaxID=2100421 RepID=A0A6J5PVE3_9CAUD|nr:hypothetical protein UFOVP996_52 [uncultured Caudovirales phage]